MLLQTLDSQGMDVKWHLQVPNGAITDESTSNEKGAALIKSVSRRPGARMKQLSQRPCVAPPSNAAVLRNGVLPRVSFPLLAELSKDRQKRSTTARGNRIGPPNDVAFMQRRQLVDFVEAAEAAEVAAAGDEDLVEEESPADSLDGSDEDEDMD